MRSVLEIITASSEFLAGRGIENARLNAEHLIGHALGLPRMQLYLQFERPLVERELEAIRGLLRRRAAREPLQYILGETEFFGLTLKVDARALIPRPETEYLVSLLTERCDAASETSPTPARILDLGTGTGAIALALAKHWEKAQVIALDASADALALARENAERNGLAAERVSFLESDWFSIFEKLESANQAAESARPGVLTQTGPCVNRAERDARLPIRASVSGGGAPPFDLIVSNPPYLSEAEVAESLAEVREHEPARALSPGESGMEALRKIVAEAPQYLRRSEANGLSEGASERGGAVVRGGLLALETGIAQHAELAELFGNAGFSRWEFLPDLAGRPRYALAWV